ncbi:hypothetical protein Ciccas_003678 [Cichlidogyrus casuarinus]|uniref:Sodium/hydrogen exchanger n=1 Tax=Cichlidogyrus casuarinus TaxID=1844966 RepID=A0ABD2QDQ0_9PLAT
MSFSFFTRILLITLIIICSNSAQFQRHPLTNIQSINATTGQPANIGDITEAVEHGHAEEAHAHKGLNVFVVDWKYNHLRTHITLIVFIFIVILIRMAFTTHYLHMFANFIPESLVLIAIGVLFGVVMRFGLKTDFDLSVWKLTPDLFLLYLLPPIILDAAYCLYNRTFGEFLGSILLYAVIGTVLNFFIIGFLMYAFDAAGAMGPDKLNLGLKGYLLFASLIVAVDPVAVLAIFNDIGVELSLYYMVFGESLLNDAVTIVLYTIMEKFVDNNNIQGYQIFLGFLSFFTIAGGGLLLGVIIGIICCLITRFKTPADFVIILLLAYFSYILGDLVGWSGLISMIGCGLVQASYAFHNIHPQSIHIVRSVTSQAAGISESIIFLYLGIQLLVQELEWHTGFMLWSLVLCIMARTIVVFLLTSIINWVRVDTTKISITEQLIMIYGGLRGAVAYALAATVNEDKFLEDGADGKQIKRVIVTDALFIILITVGAMGTTMKPLVRLLKIKMATAKHLSIFETLNNHILDQTLTGIESITGKKGRNRIRDFWLEVDAKYMRRWLQREPTTHEQNIFKTYEKIALKLHYAAIHPEKSNKFLQNLPKTLQMKHSMGSMNKLNSSISLSNLTCTLEPGTVYELSHDGNLRKRSLGGEENSVDVDQLDQMLKAQRRSSTIAANREEPFQNSLKDLLKAKGLVVRHKDSLIPGMNSDRPIIYRPNHQIFGHHNTGYSLDEVSESSISNDSSLDRKPKTQFSLGGQELNSRRRRRNSNRADKHIPTSKH